MLSAHVRLGADHDYAKVIDEAAALGAEGLDLAIVYLPPPYDTAVLEPLAEAIRDSGADGHERITIRQNPGAARVDRPTGGSPLS